MAFYPLSVKSLEKATSDCMVVGLDMPDELTDVFAFKAGQYLTFKKSINGEEVRRSYSLCAGPSEKKWKVAIKRVDNGRFSSFANDVLKTGDILEVMPPQGNFVLHQNGVEKANTYVALAAGSGITPVISIIKDVLERETQSRFLLFFGNRNFESIIFREELEALKNKHLNRFSLYHILSGEKLGSPLFYGRINGDKCSVFSRRLFDLKSVHSFFLCGPAEMIFEIKDTLTELGVEKKRIHFELFNTSGIKPAEPQNKKKAVFDRTKESKINIRLDGDVLEFTLPYDGKSILDAALESGADLPFACKGGVCSTCKAKLAKGNVEMDVNYALEEDEIEAGFILTCQSHPRSEMVYVDFDDKGFGG